MRLRFALLVAAATLWAAAPASARDAATLARIAALKRAQQELLLFEVHRPDPASDTDVEAPRILFPSNLRPLESPAFPTTVSLVPGNHRPSDPRFDLSPGSTQSEVSLATWHGLMLAAWNDGELLGNHTGAIGWGVSADGGRTWVDGGGPPLGAVVSWSSDPVVAVDDQTGRFYLTALAISHGPSNAIGIVAGRFIGTTFAWDEPHIVRVVRDTVLDKPWLAVDPASGALHIGYTVFFSKENGPSDAIEYQRSVDGGAHWTPPQRVCDPEEEGLVQGARLAVRPDGRLIVLWRAVDIDPDNGGIDRIRTKVSDDGGETFLPATQVAAVFTNYANGAPGCDRGFAVAFPSLVVDRGTGPHAGRAYAVWNESLDFYDDPVGTLGPIAEREPNEDPADATPFAVGDAILGRISTPQDVDRYRFAGEAGRTVMVQVDSVPAPPRVALRLTERSGNASMALSQAVPVRPHMIVFTLPFTGEYVLSVSPLSDSLGDYRIATGWAERGAERGRDARDVFASWSDDGRAWSEPVRVNDDAPRFEDWLPEVTVDGTGHAFVAWYDWRDMPPGAHPSSLVYMARSDDGGGSWLQLGPVSTAPTPWGDTSSNLIPNQGDYIGMAADSANVLPAWADGRSGTPDIMSSVWPSETRPDRFEPLGVAAESAVVVVSWNAQAEGLSATIQRSEDGRPWTTLGVWRADHGRRLDVADSTVRPGGVMRYRLAIETDQGLQVLSEVPVDVPGGDRVRVSLTRIAGDPRGGGPLTITWQLPGTGDGDLELFDAQGRRLQRLRIPAVARRGTLTLAQGLRLSSGVYLVRLRQDRDETVLRTVVLR